MQAIEVRVSTVLTLLTLLASRQSQSIHVRHLRSSTDSFREWFCKGSLLIFHEEVGEIAAQHHDCLTRRCEKADLVPSFYKNAPEMAILLREIISINLVAHFSINYDLLGGGECAEAGPGCCAGDVRRCPWLSVGAMNKMVG